MANLNPTLVLVLTVCLYVLIFGGLALVRKEGLSVQFAAEALAVGVLLIGGAWLLNLRLSPILLLIIVYLVTMRSRLIADLANLLVRRNRYESGHRLYQLGLSWWPDATSRLIVLANRGAAELYGGQLAAARSTLEDVLKPDNLPRLGSRYEAASRYNLGLAYERAGEDAKAVQQYNEVVDLLPGSVYARAAAAALKRRKKAPPSE